MNDAPIRHKSHFTSFQWDDALRLDEQLTEEERAIRDAAREYCQKKLLPRVIEANRHEKFHREIMNEMGEMGFLGAVIVGDVPYLGLRLRGAAGKIFAEAPQRRMGRLLWPDRAGCRLRPS